MFPDARSTGILTRNTPTFDADILNPNAAAAVEEMVRERFEERGYILVRVGRAPKRAMPFRTDKPFKKIVCNLVSVFGSEEKLEFLGDGQQVVLFGVHKDTGKPYTWFGGEPGKVRSEDLPYITAAEAQSLVDDAARLLVDQFGYTLAAQRPKEQAKANGQAAPDGSHDWGWLTSNIINGRELHGSIAALAAMAVKTGMHGGAVTNLLRGLMEIAPRDKRWQDRFDDIPRAVETAEQKFRVDAPGPAGTENGKAPPEQPAPVAIKATTWKWRDPADIGRRAWLHGTHYIRGSVTCTVGKRGGGKTNRALAEAISMVTKRDLLETGSMPERPQRVWYIGEDPRDEIERRIVAICDFYGIKADEIGDRLLFNSLLDFPPGALKLATMQGGKVVPNTALVASIIAEMKTKAIDVLILDPLKKFHGLRENDQEMDEVMTLLFEIAQRANAAVEFLHHTRKAAAGNASAPITADDARGADAIIASPRDARVTNAMSSKEAADFAIPANEAWRYSRIDDGKQNLKPPGKATWSKSASHTLPCGDSVGVLQPWTPPKPFEGITSRDAELAQQVAQTGAFRADIRAKNWFGYTLGERLGLDPRNKPANKAKLREMIKIWCKNKVLKVEQREDEQRREREFIVPGPTIISARTVADDDDF
jgi:hypothetical protein